MRDRGSVQARTCVYLFLIFYFGILVVGGALDFLLTELGVDRLLSDENMRLLDLLRARFVYVLAPFAKALSRVWPEASGAMIARPLVSLGLLASASALLFFRIYDAIRSLLKK